MTATRPTAEEVVSHAAYETPPAPLDDGSATAPRPEEVADVTRDVPATPLRAADSEPSPVEVVRSPRTTEPEPHEPRAARDEVAVQTPVAPATQTEPPAADIPETAPQTTTGPSLSESAVSLQALFEESISTTVERRRPAQPDVDPLMKDLRGLFAESGNERRKGAARRDSEAERAADGKSAVETLVTELDALFAERAPRNAAVDSRTAPSTKPVKPLQNSAPPPASRESELRSLARLDGGKRARAIFRLERQDPRTFGRVVAQYAMDVLLSTPSRSEYTVVRHDGDFLDRSRYTDGGEFLKKAYGLSVAGLDLPWLESLRERHVAMQLIPRDAVEVSLLVPWESAELIMGKIIVGCRALGHSLEDVTACYGTFVEHLRDGQGVFEYEVTRLILNDGSEVHAVGPWRTARSTS